MTDRAAPPGAAPAPEDARSTAADGTSELVTEDGQIRGVEAAGADRAIETRASRAWAAPVAWGAGLVALALGAGAIVSPVSALAATTGVLLAAVGAGALGWGGACLARGRTVAPRAGMAGAFAGILLLCVLLALSPRHTSVLALGAGVVLFAVTAAAGASASRDRRPERPAGAWVLLAAAVLVAALVTPALTAAQDAVLLQDDGTVPVLPSHAH
jgi:hypothetical protein